mgnify:CR=1 FL=1
MPEEYFHMGFHGMILGAGAYVEYEGKVIHRELMTKQEVQTVIDWGKKQKIGIIADWKMSEAVQAEISGLTEALEGSGSEISWCIYRRKEQDIVERMKKETEADALVILDAGILEEFGEQAENGTYKGAELYGVGYSLKTIALLDNGNIQGLAVPDGYEIGYKSVEEITKRIEHRSYKMQGYITEYQVLGKENFSMDEDLERFLYSYE